MQDKKTFTSLFVISFLTLFGEMVFIRYIPSNIYLLSYYKNAVLISIFLGLGIGFMMPKDRRSLIELMPVATLVLVCVIIYFNDYLRIDLDYARMDESIWPEFWSNSKAGSVPIFWVLVFFYIVMALYFIPLGQETMRAMEDFSPLKAYSVNIAGSLAGIIAFAVLGWLWTTPLVWFAVFLAPLLWWTYKNSTRLTFVLGAVSSALTLFLIFSAILGLEIWSPYSKVRVYPLSAEPGSGFISTTNGNPQVGCMNFDIDYKGPVGPLNLESRRIYEIPYASLRPEKVMVVGAGAGNETAMALRKGALSVDAVEIDPAFVAIGTAMNPHRPYTDNRVSVHVDDARAFFHKTRSRYDLIVIGFLDSQYHLTQMSNIRTENFVYTYESIKKTKELLAEEGVLQLNYNAPRLDMRVKLFNILKDVYGDDLIVFAPERPVSGNISFVAGPGVKKIKTDQQGLVTGTFTQKIEKEDYPTDDWPFLYLETKKIPKEYVPMLLMIPVLSLVMIRTINRKAAGISLKFFFLGVGFMLLETKSITSFALLFGSTVTVVSVVIASILAAGLLANLIVYKFGITSVKIPFILLFATIALLYFIPLDIFTALPWWPKLSVSVLIIAAPLFFAAIIFAALFSKSKRMDRDFGSNIFGAVVGGMSEYLSMAFGFKGLYLLSLATYAAAFISHIADRGEDG